MIHEQKGVRTIKVKEIREDILKLSQAELGKELGMTQQAYSNKETGKRAFKWQEIIRICKLAKVNPKHLDY